MREARARSLLGQETGTGINDGSSSLHGLFFNYNPVIKIQQSLSNSPLKAALRLNWPVDTQLGAGVVRRPTRPEWIFSHGVTATGATSG